MQTDPVAAESRFLSLYMSNGHPETLIAYAKWYGKVKEGISSAEMMAIDSKVSKSYTVLNNLEPTGDFTLIVNYIEHDAGVYARVWMQERGSGSA